MVAFETMHWLKSRNKGKEAFVALKTDMSKAYDRVEWQFLQHLVVKLGYCNEWIQKIITIVTTVTYNFCHNGFSLVQLFRRGVYVRGSLVIVFVHSLC